MGKLSLNVTGLLIGASVLAVASFALHLAIAQVFDRLGIYFLNDILFASDTHDVLSSIGHGERSVRTLTPDLRNSVHPYVWFYFSPFIRAAAKLAVVGGLTDMSVFDVRLALGKLVVPAIAAFQSFAFAILLSLLGLPWLAIVILVLLNGVTFSSLIYGSLSDHFMVTNLAITLLMIAAVVAYRWPNFDRLSMWIPLGLFAIGITSTNIAFLAITHFFTRRASGESGFWRSVRRSMLLSGSILAFVLATAGIAGYLLHGPPKSDGVRQDFVTQYLQARLPPAARIARAAAAVANSIAPLAEGIQTLPPPRTPKEYYPVTRPPMNEHAIYPAFTFELEQVVFGRNPLGLIAIGGILLGTIAMLVRGGRSRLAALIAMTILLFNLTLHSFWGDEYVLYSQHWMTAVMVLLAGLVPAAPRLRGAVVGATSLFAIAVAWNNATVLLQLVESLEAISAAAGWPG